MLRHPRALAALLEAIEGCERLVLLGDVLELRHGPLREALAAAEGPLRQIGAALGRDREAVLVPGNHDHRLLRCWLDRRAARSSCRLGLEEEVDWRDGEPLARIAGWLRPARVRAAYPGAWLRQDAYATHGHYGDRHTTVPIVERLGAGAMAWVVRESDGGANHPDDYEATLGPLYAWVDAVAQSGRLRPRRGGGSLQVRAWQALQGGDGRRALRRRVAAVAFPALVCLLNRAGLGPLGADVSGSELRRASLRAFAEVLRRLGVGAAHVIFGHTHRAGPLPGDDRLEWLAGAGAAMTNTGCWVYEPGFLGGDPGRSPYRPGFAALLGERGAPELLNLLDGVGAAWPAVRSTQA